MRQEISDLYERNTAAERGDAVAENERSPIARRVAEKRRVPGGSGETPYSTSSADESNCSDEYSSSPCPESREELRRRAEEGNLDLSRLRPDIFARSGQKNSRPSRLDGAKSVSIADDEKYNEMIEKMLQLRCTGKNGSDDAEAKESLRRSNEEEGGEEDLLERGPVRPRLSGQYHEEKPYTLDWIATTSRNVQENESEASDYESFIQEISRNEQLCRKLDPCLEKLSREIPYDYNLPEEWSCRKNWEETSGGEGGYSRNNWSSAPVQAEPQAFDLVGERSLLRRSPEATTVNSEAELLEKLMSGFFQPADPLVIDNTWCGSAEAAVESETATATATAASAVASNVEYRSDSPRSILIRELEEENGRSRLSSSSCCHSCASSIADSAGESSANVGSPLFDGTRMESLATAAIESKRGGGSGCGVSRRSAAGISSSESSNHSFGETSSPLGYQYGGVDWRIEEELGLDFEGISTGYPNYASSDTVVNSTEEGIDAIVKNELERVEEAARRDFGVESSPVYEAAPAAPTLNTTEACRTNGGCRWDDGAAGGRRRRKAEEYKEERGCCGSGGSLARVWSVEGDISEKYWPRTERSAGKEIRHSAPRPIGSRARRGDYRSDEQAAGSSSFEIPESGVSSFHLGRSREGREAALWSSLNVPETAGCERLIAALDPREVERAMKNLLKREAEELAAGDEYGETVLMRLVGDPLELKKKLAYIVPLVERLEGVSGALARRNIRDEDALYIAATRCPEIACASGYLAAVMLRKRMGIGQFVYRGESLIDAVAAKGESHAAVLADLLALRTMEGNLAFDRTQRESAVEIYDRAGSAVSGTRVRRLSRENGADERIGETRTEKMLPRRAIRNRQKFGLGRSPRPSRKRAKDTALPSVVPIEEEEEGAVRASPLDARASERL